jgi:hypothetical protein
MQTTETNIDWYVLILIDTHMYIPLCTNHFPGCAGGTKQIAYDHIPLWIKTSAGQLSLGFCKSSA